MNVSALMCTCGTCVNVVCAVYICVPVMCMCVCLCVCLVYVEYVCVCSIDYVSFVCGHVCVRGIVYKYVFVERKVPPNCMPFNPSSSLLQGYLSEA